MSEELKPCPFCGGRGYVRDSTVASVTQYEIFCGRCGATSIRAHQKADAIAHWNTRYTLKDAILQFLRKLI